MAFLPALIPYIAAAGTVVAAAGAVQSSREAKKQTGIARSQAEALAASASDVTAMPDYDSLTNQSVRKKSLVDAANRKGRMSTILTATDLTDNSEKLGG